MTNEFIELFKQSKLNQRLVFDAILSELHDCEDHLDDILGKRVPDINSRTKVANNIREVVIEHNHLVQMHNTMCETYGLGKRRMIEMESVQAMINRVSPLKLQLVS